MDKLPEFRIRLGAPKALQGTVEHALHRQRRMALNPYFSRRKINDFSPFIQQHAERLCTRLTREYAGTSNVVTLNDAWVAYTTDIIIYYCFGWSYNVLDSPNFIGGFTSAIQELVDTVHVAGHFPWFANLLQSAPDFVMKTLNPGMMPVLQLQNVGLYPDTHQSFFAKLLTYPLLRKSNRKSSTLWMVTTRRIRPRRIKPS